MTFRPSIAPMLLVACGTLLIPSSASATSILFSNMAVTNQMAAGSRPVSPGVLEIEAADDFVLGTAASITSASFIGLVPQGFNVSDLNLEIYRIFPLDSGPFDNNVPTRANSPSDVAFAERDLASGIASFSTTIISNSFTALNSVLNGIFPSPNQQTMGEGPVIGQEVQFNVVFSVPIDLPMDHYFFVPQVGLSTGNFFWLSASRPIAPPGTPVPPGFTDLQAWIRNGNLDPDWLRVGQDIVGGNPFPTFNMAFELRGDTPVPEPTSLLLLGTGLAAAVARRRRRS
jgi:PEP-CTERM motif-containing protein